MNKVEQIDANFAVNTTIKRDGTRFYPATADCFSIHGICASEGKFRRMPREVAEGISEGVSTLHTHTAGGRIRFCTTSSYVIISAKMTNIFKMPHFTLLGSAGFDLYEKIDGKQVFIGSGLPPMDINEGYDSIWELDGQKLHELTLHFPLYSGVDTLYIGLDENANVASAPAYSFPKPVVYYGSSITQGGCASRPGNAYPNQISLMLDCDHINLGFSGNAKAEDTMADYICQMDMSALVLDYDHNAPDPEYLEKTHKKMFDRIRTAKPELPIIMLSMPRIPPMRNAAQLQRMEIIQRTYNSAIADGDQNVYFIPGIELFGERAEVATVDNCHPNDIGFYLMASKIAPILKSIITK